MAERSKAAVLKTVEGNSLPGFESLSLRQQVLSFIEVEVDKLGRQNNKRLVGR